MSETTIERLFPSLRIEHSEALMVGDRLDNDIAPARAHGWQTWQLGNSGDGDWNALWQKLRSHPAPNGLPGTMPST